jgi:membrane protein required for colicin V production
MIIDVIYLILLILFLVRGYRKGIVVALFAVISIIIGIFCALKFSGLIAGWLFKDAKGSAWIPFFSYIIVFVLTVWLIRLGANAIGKLMDAVFIGWLNRLAGAILYAFLITLIFSTFLWFVNGIGIIKASTVADSRSYSFLVKFAPEVFSMIGKLLPFMKDCFHDLSVVFGTLKARV